MNIGVIGAGHVGLVVAAGLARLGHQVTGIDLPDRMAQLNAVDLPFFEPQLDELVRESLKESKLRFTADLQALAPCDAVFLTLCTSQDASGALDIRLLEDVAAELGRIVSSRCVIICKSTVPVGTCRQLQQRMPPGGPEVICNPEFLREGYAVADFLFPTKIVIGTASGEVHPMITSVYCEVDAPIHFVQWEDAEAFKVVQNTYNALRISFLNELTMTFAPHAVSIDVVSRLLREDHANLGRYLRPGFAFGGSCLPNNVRYIQHLNLIQGRERTLMQATLQVNEDRIGSLLNSLEAQLGGLHGKTVTLWGLTYTANTDDLRESPSVAFAHQLQKRGSRVQVLDPHVPTQQIEALGWTACTDARTSLLRADAVVTLVRHDAFLADVAALSAGEHDAALFDVAGLLETVPLSAARTKVEV